VKPKKTSVTVVIFYYIKNLISWEISLSENISTVDIALLKSNIMSKNGTGDFNVNTVAFGIDNDGRGILCLVDVTKEKAECQDFLVPSVSISDDIISLLSFPK
jgi:hypothetical protein